MRIIDPIKSFDVEGGLKFCKNGIGRSEIAEESLFEISPFDNDSKTKELDEKVQKRMLTAVKKAILKRLQKYEEEIKLK